MLSLSEDTTLHPSYTGRRRKWGRGVADSSERVHTKTRYKPVDAPECFAGAQRAFDTQLERTVLLWTPPEDVDDRRISEYLSAPPHPNLAVARSDVVVDDRRTIVLDDLDGVLLADRLAVDELTAEEAARWVGEVRAAVAHLHAAGVAHGAVGTDNVVLVPDGDAHRAVVVGFGATASRRRDARQVRRLAQEVAAGCGVGWRQRRSLLRLLGVNPRRRYPLVAFAVTALVATTVVAAISRDEALREPNSSALPIVVAPPREQRAQPVVALVPEPVSTVDGATGSTRHLSEVLDLLGPRARQALPERVAVYRTTATTYGLFDVYEGHTAGVPVLQYRTTGLSAYWRNIVSLGDGWLLFYRDFDGYMTTAPVEANGQLGFGDATIKDDPGWSHVVHAGHGLAWFYDSDTGGARLIRYVDGFHTIDRRIADPGVGAGAAAVVGLGDGRVLHYFARDGRTVVLKLDTTGEVIDRHELRLPRSLTALAATDDGMLLGVGPLPPAQVMRIGDNSVAEMKPVDLDGALWTTAVGFGRGVLVTSLTGAIRIVTLPPNAAPHITKWRIPVNALAAVVK